MNPDEISDFLSVARVDFSAVNRVLVHGTEAGEDQSVIALRLRRWGATLADVDFATAKRCLDAMHRGDTDYRERLSHLSDWADHFPAYVRRWCREHRSLEMPNLRYQSDDEGPRYRCLSCRDTGWVTVMSPHYIDEHFEIISGNRLCPITPQDVRSDPAKMDELRKWFLDAKAWCRSKCAGHLITSVVCDCEAAATKRAENGGRIRVGVLNRKSMPLVDGGGQLFAREAAERFIDAAGDFDQRHEWNPDY